MNKTRMIERILKKAGTRLLYAALLMYYAFKRPDIPSWAKSICIGVIGYLISPFDSIPDLTPVIGYTDDFGLLSYALVLIAAYINQDVRSKARHRLEKITGHSIDQEIITAIEKHL